MGPGRSHECGGEYEKDPYTHRQIAAYPRIHRIDLFSSGIVVSGLYQSLWSIVRSSSEGSSFSGAFTRMEIGHMVIGSDG